MRPSRILPLFAILFGVVISLWSCDEPTAVEKPEAGKALFGANQPAWCSTKTLDRTFRDYFPQEYWQQIASLLDAVEDACSESNADAVVHNGYEILQAIGVVRDADWADDGSLDIDVTAGAALVTGLYAIMQDFFYCVDDGTCAAPALSTADIEESLSLYGLFGVVGGPNSDYVTSLGLDPAWGLEPDLGKTWDDVLPVTYMDGTTEVHRDLAFGFEGTALTIREDLLGVAPYDLNFLVKPDGGYDNLLVGVCEGTSGGLLGRIGHGEMLLAKPQRDDPSFCVVELGMNNWFQRVGELVLGGSPVWPRTLDATLGVRGTGGGPKDLSPFDGYVIAGTGQVVFLDQPADASTDEIICPKRDRKCAETGSGIRVEIQTTNLTRLATGGSAQIFAVDNNGSPVELYRLLDGNVIESNPTVPCDSGICEFVGLRLNKNGGYHLVVELRSVTDGDLYEGDFGSGESDSFHIRNNPK